MVPQQHLLKRAGEKREVVARARRLAEGLMQAADRARLLAHADALQAEAEALEREAAALHQTAAPPPVVQVQQQVQQQQQASETRTDDGKPKSNA